MHILYSGSQTLGVKWAYTILGFKMLKNTFTCTGGKKKLTQKIMCRHICTVFLQMAFIISNLENVYLFSNLLHIAKNYHTIINSNKYSSTQIWPLSSHNYLYTKIFISCLLIRLDYCRFNFKQNI